MSDSDIIIFAIAGVVIILISLYVVISMTQDINKTIRKCDEIGNWAKNELRNLTFKNIEGLKHYRYRCIDPDDVRALPTITPPLTWVPITKQAPKENGYYLTSTINREVYCDYWSYDHFDRTEAVVAWMKLPEPYKGGEKDG